MKQSVTGFLLFIFIANSMVHPLLFSIEYEAVQRSLTHLETELSLEKAAQIGKSQAIIVLDEHNARKRGDVYGQNIFAEEHYGKTICYTIVDSSELLDYQQITKKAETDPFSPKNHSVFFKLPKDLYYQTAEIKLVTYKTSFENLHFLLYINAKTDPFFTVPTPPPNPIA